MNVSGYSMINIHSGRYRKQLWERVYGCKIKMGELSESGNKVRLFPLCKWDQKAGNGICSSSQMLYM